MINRVRAAGSLTVTKSQVHQSAVSVHMGGIAGESHGLGIIRDVGVFGSLEMLIINESDENHVNYICGGIIGKMRDGNLFNCDFSGSIILPDNYNVTRTTYIGGIAGTIGMLFEDTSATVSWKLNEQNQAEISIENSTASGDFILNHAGLGFVNIGGISASVSGSFSIWSGTTPIGLLINPVIFINCEYRDGSILFTRLNSGEAGQNIGGFFGEVFGGIELENCRSRTGLVRVISEASATVNPPPGFSNADVSVFNVGGFAGIIRGDLDASYSHSIIDVDFRGEGYLNVGGFAGTRRARIIYAINPGWWQDNLISRSYAAGSITVNATSPYVTSINVGGFIGYLSGSNMKADYYDIDSNFAHVDVL